MNVEKHNYRAFLLDGGLFIGGLSFVNAQTLLPGVILDAGGPSWLAAFVPSAMIIGAFSMPVLVAPLIDRLKTLKPYALRVGVFQRGVYLLAALLLLAPALGSEHLVWIVGLAPLLSGVIGGIGFTAFQRLYIKCVPPRLRASSVAYRFLFGGVTGFMAGFIIKWLLETLELAQALGILHLIAFGCMAVSWGMLARVKEPEDAVEETVGGVAGSFDLLAGVRDLLAPEPGRRSRLAFVMAVVGMHTFFLATPFFAAYLQRLVEAPVSFLGLLATWSMVGNAVGNFVAAWLGDRFGGRLTMALGAFATLLVLAVTPFIGGVVGACSIYALFGFAIMLMIVGKDALLMDMGPTKRQSSYLALMAFITMLSLFFSSGTSWLLWELTADFTVLAWAGALGSLGCFVAVSYVDEPRTDIAVSPLARVRRGILRFFR